MARGGGGGKRCQEVSILLAVPAVEDDAPSRAAFFRTGLLPAEISGWLRTVRIDSFSADKNEML